ncbi:MAG: hypothetical protein EXR27_17100 [Betaproteobacteria bacterium]|nr:hypothetical protein [Betaproteobacteria bacterium]
MSQLGIIDGIPFARGGHEQRGEAGLDHFARLLGLGCRACRLQFWLRGATNDQGRPCLRLKLTGEIELICQRCLRELDFPILIDTELELCEDFRSIAEAEDEVDRVVADREMCVAHLLEDEIMLALPMVPSHQSCTPSVTTILPQAARELPFGALAGLKRGS